MPNLTIWQRGIHSHRAAWKLALAQPFSYVTRMLSVLIETGNDEEDLARTLVSLIGGAVEGMVRDVIVFDHGSADRTREVAEHAGCVVEESGDLVAAINRAKSEWLLVLQPGARLPDGWMDDISAHIAKAVIPARFSRSRAHRMPFLARAFSRPAALAQGLLIPRKQALVLSKNASSTEAIARGLAVKTLRAEIEPAA